MKSKYKIMFAAILIIVVGCLAINFYMYVSLTSKKQKFVTKLDIFRENFAKHLPRYLEDQKELNSLSFMISKEKKNNANELFHNILPIFGDDSTNTRLLLPNKLNDILSEYENESWIKNANNIDTSGVDFSWLTDLHNYGYLDFKSENNQSSDIFGPVSMPEVYQLINFSRARLIRGIQTGDLVGALSDTRQIAIILYSSDITIYNLVALSLLEIENVVYQNFQNDLGNKWHTYKIEDIEKARRVIFLSSVALHLQTPNSIVEKIFLESSPYKICTTLYAVHNSLDFELLASEHSDMFFKTNLEKDKRLELIRQIQDKYADCNLKIRTLNLEELGMVSKLLSWNSSNTWQAKLFFKAFPFALEHEVLKIGAYMTSDRAFQGYKDP